MRGSLKRVLWWSGLGVAGMIAVLVLVPLFLNPEYLKTLALQQIQRTFGSHVNVGQTSFALFPHPHFMVSDIVVQDRPESHAVFRAQSMSLELGIGQLLMKKIVVRELLVEHPEIELRRDPEGEWRFLKPSSDDSLIASLANFLVMEKFEISGGKVIVIDESPHETVRGFVIEDVECESKSVHEGPALSSIFELSGNLRQGEASAPFNIQGNVEAMLNTGMPSIGSRPGLFEQVTFSGQVTAGRVEVQQFVGYLPQADTLADFPGTLNVQSRVHWVQNPKTSQVHLTDIHVSSSFITLGGTANFEVLEDGHHMMGVSMHSANVDLDMIRRYLPRAWMPDAMIPVWERGQWGGKLDIAEARVISSTREDVKTSVTGTFRLHEGYVTLAGRPPAAQIQGTIVVEPDRVQLSDIQGVYDGIPVDVTEGVLLFKDAGPWGDVEIQGPVPAEKVLRFVIGLGAPSDFGPLESWTVSQGSGRLRLRFTGPLLESPGLRFQSGDYHPQNLVLGIPGLPHPLANAHGKILFSRDRMSIEGIQGNVGAYPFMMQGTIHYQGPPRFESFTLTGGVEGRDLLREFSYEQKGHEVELTGPFTTSITLSGPARQVKFKGWVDGEDAFIDVPSVIQKQAGQESLLEFDGQLRPEGIIQLDRVELTMLPLRLLGQAAIRVGPEFMWKGRFNSGPVYLELLPEGIRVLDQAIQAGVLEIQLKGSGRGTDWTRWNTQGWVALTDGVVAVRGVQEPMSNLFVRLKIDQDQLDLKRMEFHLKDSEAVITGFIKDWKTAPAVSVMLASPQFDIDLLIPKKKRSVIRNMIEWLAAHGTLEGSVHIERPRYKTLSGKNLSAVLNIHDNLVSVDKVQTMVEDHGTLGGRMFIHLPQNRAGAMRASFTASDLPFQQVLNVLEDERRFVTGRLNMRGMIQGHGRNKRGIVPTLNGNVEFTLKDGYVRKGTVLPRILALLNLPQVLQGKVDLEETGFPFTTVSSNVAIEEGKFSTTNFLLDSTIMKSSAAGAYDLPSDWLEGIVAVSPFGSYSDLLKDIPLFGRIFFGERKGIATAMFALSGPLNDPKVDYMPMESLKTGLTGLAELTIDVLRNTITLPYDLFKEANEPPLRVPSSSRPAGGAGL